jgi:hypothetical protein
MSGELGGLVTGPTNCHSLFCPGNRELLMTNVGVLSCAGK